MGVQMLHFGEVGRIVLYSSFLFLLLCMPSFVLAEHAAIEDEISSLRTTIDSIIEQRSLSSAWVGVRVESLQGDVIYDYNGDKLFMPASNMKLISAAAGLQLLGADYTWETSVWADISGDDDDEELIRTEGNLPDHIEGNIYLQGGGDPTLLEAHLRRLAGDLFNRGIRSVGGDIVYDASFFDGVLYGPSWHWDYLDRYYAAPVSGLAISPDTDYDANTVRVSVYPANELLEPGVVRIEPSLSGITVVNDVSTSGAGATPSLRIVWEDEETLIVSGHVPLRSGANNEWVPVPDPAYFTARVFQGALEQAGIRVAGEVVSGRISRDAQRIAVHTSQQLSQLLIPFMKLSNNGHGEVILKTLGRKFRSEGSWPAGRTLMNTFLRDIVKVRGEFNISDGSGLSRMNLISPTQFTALLRYMEQSEHFNAFYESLPIAGVSGRFVGGTLSSRMRGTDAFNNARAKTGTLGNVSALSGYVTNAAGERLVYSIMINHALSAPSQSIQDQIVSALAPTYITFSD